MSSDDADLGGLGPTTPAPPPKAAISKRNVRSTKQHGQPNAGPSKHAARKGGRTRQISMDFDSIIDVDHGEGIDEFASVQTESMMPQHHRKPSAAADNSNARQQNAIKNDKGKQRATSRSRGTRRQPQPEVQIIEDSDINAEVQEDEDEDSLPRSLAQAINKSTAPTQSHPQQPVKDSAFLRERKRADEAETRCQELLNQLEEIYRLRHTEPEKLLEEVQEQHQAEIEAKDKLIQELNSALARVEPLSKSGKTSVIHLLTREAADEEKKSVQQEVARLKAELVQKDIVIKEKDKMMSEKETIERELKYELQIERENAQKDRLPGSVQRGRGGVLGSDDPKNTEVIKFYEDLTNLLVTNMKPTPGKSGKDEWSLTCIYSYVGEGDDPLSKSVNFSLRSSHDSKTAEGVGSESRTMFFVPQSLEKETPDFIQKLGFLGTSFSFPRSQLPLFLRTIYTTIGDALADDDVEVLES
ncbi:hypothetical protein E1B28_009027 [Marasmius oreades]|uniref:Monopolin complex subunit Csm1/Pcs1 C-terminal domain-containing protein n=1 Tax=Marasmius oreades TaxID=181124 RepID=A0A9P7RZK7_9AGAR|nr:uncharacterized protein E1B28_009027 [Marasmius oreades]KAG7092696.1 hypothetical protein E1B28_009027 [Marasmius oreades]